MARSAVPESMCASAWNEMSPLPDSELDLLGGLRRRVLVSIAATVGWVSFVLLFVAFLATGLDLLQSVAVVLVSVLVLVGILAGAWFSFGLAFADPWFD